LANVLERIEVSKSNLARRGGFLATEILHLFDIDGSKKGILITKNLDEEYQNASGLYRQGPALLRK